MLEVNETRFLVQYDPCKCNATQKSIVCNAKQKWIRDKCRYECKELDEVWNFCKKRLHIESELKIGEYRKTSFC